MMRLRAGSGGGYACRVQRRKVLAAECEAVELVSGIERSPPVHSCRPKPPQDSSLTHGGSPLAIARGGRRRLSTQKSANRVSVHANNALASVLASIHHGFAPAIACARVPLAGRLP